MIVRNPIDVIPSIVYLRNLQSHSLVPNENISEEFPEFWKETVEGASKTIETYHQEIISNLSKKIPTFYVRFEDLKLNPRNTLKDLFCFIL